MVPSTYALLGYRHNQNFRIITFRSINRVKIIELISQKMSSVIELVLPEELNEERRSARRERDE
jgi:hypothetical protein